MKMLGSKSDKPASSGSAPSSSPDAYQDYGHSYDDFDDDLPGF
jgi:hypothetical protein